MKKKAPTLVCPSPISNEARSVWEKLAADLRKAGAASALEGEQLSLYITAYQRWKDAEAKVSEAGPVIKSAQGGFPIENPFLRVANQSMAQCTRYLAKLRTSIEKGQARKRKAEREAEYYEEEEEAPQSLPIENYRSAGA